MVTHLLQAFSSVIVLQTPAIAISVDCYILAMLFYLFSSTDFSTSLGRFLRNFATRHDVSQNILSPVWAFVHAP